MAIVIACPGCRVRLTLGDDRAGESLDCPKCDAVISVPFLLPPPSPPARRTPLPLPPPVERDWASIDDSERDDEDDSDLDDTPLPRRRGRRRRRSGMVTAVAVLCFIGGSICIPLSLSMFRMREGGLAVLLLGSGITDVFAAHGIWNRRHWGYVLGLVVGGISCLDAVACIAMGDPIGMILSGGCGIFALIVLLNPRYADEFS